MVVRFKTIVALVSFVCCISDLIAQPGPVFTSSYNSGMLNSDRFSDKSDVFVLNPAILSFDPTPIVSTQVQSRFSGFNIFSYGLNALAALPGNFGAGASLSQFGKEDFKYFTTSISIGKRLNPKLGLGFRQQFSRMSIVGDPRDWHGSSLISLTYKTKFLGVALHVDGLFPFGTDADDNRNWTTTIAGFYKLTLITTFFLTISNENERLRASIGVRQKIVENIELLAGMQIYPARYGIGFTLPLTSLLKGIISTELHPVLGWSPSMGILWNIKRK